MKIQAALATLFLLALRLQPRQAAFMQEAR
ncbi:hypothetical protein M622_17225 [Thauera terpenica 58Eu]|uniref:Uncharacterized protein n=1 Tax=Thauera terpenica 58Eu TaxID=1348657 RepID=T0AQ67_9RHOO|nr:hypothetical protein M622_17225 [Thauera terpenica 58Eu]